MASRTYLRPRKTKTDESRHTAVKSDLFYSFNVVLFYSTNLEHILDGLDIQ
jgi:hypothetical protein